jgi:concentrative nucleoside transporter, CNT family
MNLISLVGLVAILGIAWALSYHRRRQNLRTIAWGLGLQFLFAVIILRAGWVSFTGMAVLVLLIAAYLTVRDVTAEPEVDALGDATRARPGWAGPTLYANLGGLLLGAALAAVGVYVLPVMLPIALAVLLVTLLVNVKARFLTSTVATALVITFLTVGLGWLISQGLDGRTVFAGISAKVAAFLNLSDYGAAFLFGNLVNGEHFFTAEGAAWPGFGFQFAFKVLPTILFFGGFMAVLYHLGVMQVVIEALSRFMRWSMGTSGAETLSCSANIFVGQTEAPLLIKPFLAKMTRSELLTVMVGGFATIAGGVLAGYIAMGVPAGHLIAASVMSAPAALVIGKILFPETEHSETAGDVKLPEIPAGGNVIEAATNGITDGLKLAVNVGAMLIGFIALIAVVDVLLNWADGWIDGVWLGGEQYAYQGGGGLSPATGEFAGAFPGSLRTFFGTLLAPLAFLMGVPWNDAQAVGSLLGVKLSLNEFVAFGNLAVFIDGGILSERSIIIATYALTGFANFSSIGIQIGGISALAPERRGDLAKVGLKAMFGGALASWLTATIAGILL